MGSVDVSHMSTGIRPSKKACRSLFGPVDHDELRETLRKEREALEEADTTRWNFNFGKEIPLDGRWQWERINILTSATPLTSLSGHSVTSSCVASLSGFSVTSSPKRKREQSPSKCESKPVNKASRVEELSTPKSDNSSQSKSCDSSILNSTSPATSSNSHVVTESSTTPQQSLITDHFVKRKSRTPSGETKQE